MVNIAMQYGFFQDPVGPFRLSCRDRVVLDLGGLPKYRRCVRLTCNMSEILSMQAAQRRNAES